MAITSHFQPTNACNLISEDESFVLTSAALLRQLVLMAQMVRGDKGSLLRHGNRRKTSPFSFYPLTPYPWMPIWRQEPNRQNTGVLKNGCIIGARPGWGDNGTGLKCCRQDLHLSKKIKGRHRVCSLWLTKTACFSFRPTINPHSLHKSSTQAPQEVSTVGTVVSTCQNKLFSSHSVQLSWQLFLLFTLFPSRP